MKRSKKSSNKKPVVIFIYGPIAAGKLTVAEILHKKLGFKLTHNHAINDVVDSLFQRGTPENGNVKLHFRYYLMTEAVKTNINIITTYCYSHDFIYPNGLTEEQFVRNLRSKLVKLGARFLSVHLKANKAELLKRVNMESRKRFGKLKNKKILRELMKTKDWHTSPKLKDNFILDNSKISANKAADMIIKYFKLKKLS